MTSTERDLAKRAATAARIMLEYEAWEMPAPPPADPLDYAWTAQVITDQAAALASIRAERDMAERAAVEAAIPLEALLMAGQGPLSDAVWDGVRNGVGHVRSMLKARAARAIAGEQKP